MSLVEQSSQEITVPSSLPMILKQFCKAAIRTQPYDLLRWSSSYFRALADGEDPPTKLRLEYPPPSTASGLTLGFLRILLRQFGDYNKLLPVETILRRWDCLCLDRKDLNLIMMIGRFRQKCQVKKFLAIAVGLLGSSLFDTMIMICELFTHEPEGGSAMVPVTLFMEIYGYLAGLRCDGTERETSEQDPTEFIICNESSNTGSMEEQPVREEEKISMERVCSVTSQDTDADVNLDLELVSKGDPDSSLADVTPRLVESGAEPKQEKTKQKDSAEDLALRMRDSTEGSKTESGSVRKSSQEEASRKSRNSSRKSSNSSSTAGPIKNESAPSVEDTLSKGKGHQRLSSADLIKYYPNIPGIGPRLSAEEVASVAIWLSECARLQGGMVGPRNLRHINCPPLDRHQQPES